MSHKQDGSGRVTLLWQRWSGPLLALASALLLGALLVLLLGGNPVTVYGTLFGSIFGSAYGFGQVLFKTTTLMGTGLAVAIAFRAGFFNIGVEGQMYLGGLAAGAFALSIPQGTPSVVGCTLVLLAAAVVGGIWAAIPGLLKAWLGVHEVINTIMMNFIAFALGSYLLVEHLALFETLHTREIAESLRFARLDQLIPAFRGAPVNVALLLQFGLCVGAYLLFWRSRWGFEVRCVGRSPEAARTAGIGLRRRMVEAMFLSGCVAGMTAANFVQGYKYYFEEGFTAEAGFKGIAVALLARSHPLALIPAAFLFGSLDRGAFAINRLVPKELVDILQALVILLVIVFVQRSRMSEMRQMMSRARGESPRQGPGEEEPA